MATIISPQPLQFIDSSPVIAEQVREKESNIDKVITSDVCLYAASTPAENLIIVCRISAFWNKSEQFDNLADAILAYPRKMVLVDFYDSDMVAPRLNLNFMAKSGSGNWYFESIEESSKSNPSFQIANIRISYSLPGINCCYKAHRSFFKKSAIRNWVMKKLKGYHMEIKPSLLEADPSFLLKLSPK